MEDVLLHGEATNQFNQPATVGTTDQTDGDGRIVPIPTLTHKPDGNWNTSITKLLPNLKLLPNHKSKHQKTKSRGTNKKTSCLLTN